MFKELACERECSRGEDYRLIKLTITDFNVSDELQLLLISLFICLSFWTLTTVEVRGHSLLLVVCDK